MKKTILFIMLAGFINLSAQTTSPAHTTNEVAPCTGNSAKPLDLGEKSIMFNQAGINLLKYDWSNQNLNCHINEAMKKRKDNKTFKSMGWLLLAAGAGLAIGGGLGSSSNKGSYSGDGGAGAFIGLGIGMTAISIPCFIGGSNNKKKADYHLRQVMDYYQKKGL